MSRQADVELGRLQAPTPRQTGPLPGDGSARASDRVARRLLRAAADRARAWSRAHRRFWLVAGLVVFAGAALYVQVRGSHDLLLQRLQDRAENLGGLVADLAARHLEEPRAFELNAIVQEVVAQPDVASAQIIDPNGNIVADGNDDRRTLFPVTRSALVAESLATGRRVFTRSPGVVNAAIPVVSGERVLGAVHLRIVPASLAGAVVDAIATGLLFGLPSLAAAILAGALWMRLWHRTNRLAGTARRIVDGDIEPVFGRTPDGDVGVLQSALAYLAAALSDNMAENRRLASTDPVTGLPNRRAFRRGLKRLLKVDAPRLGGALLFVDLDRFKRVNDTFGHAAGDELLRLIGARLREFFRRYRSPHKAVVARFGADEFTILLPGLTRENAELVAAQVVEALSRAFELRGQEIVLAASIGVTIFPDDGKDCDKLLRNADLAMCAAKASGRRTVRLYSSKLNLETVERFTLEEELRKAVAGDQIRVFYQPKVSCDDGRIVAAEALMRWQHPSRGLLAPAAFLEIAEEAGLAADLSWRVLELAVRDAARIPAGESPISLAVNVSARQFEEHDFPERVANILDLSGFDPSLLELELTESLAMREPERVFERMTPLKALGVRFAIDDFGTGYSSLSYLTRLPIDTVKIDRSFVRAARTSADDCALVTMILRMAQSLNFSTVAEGIETQEDFDFVRQQGARLAQGYLFSPPLPYRDFLELLTKFRRGAGAVGEGEPAWRRAAAG